jgi:hypothetical protein
MADEVVIEEVTSEKNAIQQSLEKKEFSYYHAHGKEKEVIPDELRRGGDDPLSFADGAAPKRIENDIVKKPEEKITWIDDLAFGDESGKVKLYIDFPESLEGAEITCDFRKFGLTLIARLPNGGTAYGFYIEPDNYWILEPDRSNGLHAEVVPDQCKYRVSSSKQKITVTLAKADKNEGWHELRKKVPKFCK